MSAAGCLLISIGTAGIGLLALFVGIRSDNAAAKVGGCFITVVGVLGAIACSLTS